MSVRSMETSIGNTNEGARCFRAVVLAGGRQPRCGGGELATREWSRRIGRIFAELFDVRL